MIKPRDIPLNAVMDDSPGELVLENKGPRFLGGIAALLLIPAFLFGPFRLDEQAPPGDENTIMAAQILFALVMLSGLVGAVDRRQIIFGSGAVRFTSRVLPWGRLHRPLSEIEQVEIKTVTATFYGEDDIKHHLYLVFRDQRRHEINRSTDGAFINALAARIEEFRR